MTRQQNAVLMSATVAAHNRLGKRATVTLSHDTKTNKDRLWIQFEGASGFLPLETNGQLDPVAFGLLLEALEQVSKLDAQSQG